MSDYSAGLDAVNQYATTLTQPGPVTTTTDSTSLVDDLWGMIRGANPLPPPTDVFSDPTLGQPQGLLSQDSITRHGPGVVGGVVGSAVGGIPGAAIGSGLGEMAGQWAAGEKLDPTKGLVSGALGGAAGVACRGLEMAGRLGKMGLQSAGVLPKAADNLSGNIDLSGFLRAVDALRQKFGAVGMYTKGDAATTPVNATLAQLDELQTALGGQSQVPLTTANTLRELVGGYFDVQKNASIPSAARKQLYAALMGDLRGAVGSNPAVGPYLDDLANAYIARGLAPTGGMERIGSGLAGLGAAGLVGAGASPVTAAAPLLGMGAYLAGRGLYRTPQSWLEALLSGLGPTANPYR